MAKKIKSKTGLSKKKLQKLALNALTSSDPTSAFLESDVFDNLSFDQAVNNLMSHKTLSDGHKKMTLYSMLHNTTPEGMQTSAEFNNDGLNKFVAARKESFQKHLRMAGENRLHKMFSTFSKYGLTQNLSDAIQSPGGFWPENVQVAFSAWHEEHKDDKPLPGMEGRDALLTWESYRKRIENSTKVFFRTVNLLEKNINEGVLIDIAKEDLTRIIEVMVDPPGENEDYDMDDFGRARDVCASAFGKFEKDFPKVFLTYKEYGLFPELKAAFMDKYTMMPESMHIQLRRWEKEHGNDPSLAHELTDPKDEIVYYSEYIFLKYCSALDANNSPKVEKVAIESLLETFTATVNKRDSEDIPYLISSYDKALGGHTDLFPLIFEKCKEHKMLLPLVDALYHEESIAPLSLRQAYNGWRKENLGAVLDLKTSKGKKFYGENMEPALEALFSVGPVDLTGTTYDDPRQYLETALNCVMAPSLEYQESKGYRIPPEETGIARSICAEACAKFSNSYTNMFEKCREHDVLESLRENLFDAGCLLPDDVRKAFTAWEESLKPEGFLISDQLTGPQKEFFGHLNSILELTGTSTEAFTDHYLKAANDIVSLIVYDVRDLGIDRFSKASKKCQAVVTDQLTSRSKVREVREKISKAGSYYKYTNIPTNTFKIIKPINNLEDLKVAMEKHANFVDMIKKEIEGYRQVLGCPADTTSATKMGLDTAINGLPQSDSTDVLALYASGSYLMKDLMYLQDYDLVDGKVTLPSAHKVFLSALEGSAMYIVSERKNSQLKNSVRDLISQMQTGFPDCLMTQEELERKSELSSAAEADKEAKQALLEKEKFKDMLTGLSITEEEWKRRQAEEKEEEARRPEPYELTDIQKHAQRIRRSAGKYWRDIRDVKGRNTIRMIEQLWVRELEPLRALLNRKVPEHKELGDALFSDPMMYRAGYAYTPIDVDISKKDKQKALNNGTAEQSALRMAFVACFKKGQEENADGVDRQISDLLVTSPIIAPLAAGNQASLEELRRAQSTILTTREM